MGAPLTLSVTAAGLVAALRWCDLGLELPLLADGSPRPKAEVHDLPLSEGGLTPIRIRIGDKWSHRRNSLKR